MHFQSGIGGDGAPAMLSEGMTPVVRPSLSEMTAARQEVRGLEV